MDNMIHPNKVIAPMPHEDMPSSIQVDFEEARQIAALSPRGAAGLLRLCIQNLMKHLGEPGKDINTDIGSLVAKGLPVKIQRAMDATRIMGNQAVHPGVIDWNDTPETALVLFRLINLIVDNQIAEPKRVDVIYAGLPPEKLKAIENRDKPKP